MLFLSLQIHHRCHRAAAASENVVENGLRGSDLATRELYKKGKGKDGAGPKEQTWSCEIVNGEILGTDVDPTCGNGGQKGGDTCQPCCLCDGGTNPGVCSTLRPEGATEDKACPAGIPLLGSGSDNCNDACSR